MLPTPSTSHVSYETVYEPAEDSFLFLDTLSSAAETAWLRVRFAPANQTPRSLPRTTQTASSPTNAAGVPLVVELGPGSGVIVAFLTAHARAIFGTDIVSLAVDVNMHACRATRTTVATAVGELAPDLNDLNTLDADRVQRDASSAYAASVCSNLTDSLRPGATDVLVFNPPYVPTDAVPALPASNAANSHGPLHNKLTFEEASHLLSLSYAGGHHGMEVTNRLLAQIPDTLSDRGVAYVLFCRGNRPDDVKAQVREWPSATPHDNQHTTPPWKWAAVTVGESGKVAGWEKLEIVRIWRQWHDET